MEKELQKMDLERTVVADSVRGLAAWFEIDIEIKLFGKTIFKWKFPPEETTK